MNLNEITLTFPGPRLIADVKRKLDKVKILAEQEQAMINAAWEAYIKRKREHDDLIAKDHNEYEERLTAWGATPKWKRWLSHQPWLPLSWQSRLPRKPWFQTNLYRYTDLGMPDLVSKYPDELKGLEELYAFLKKNGSSVAYTITAETAIYLESKEDVADENA